MRYFLVNYLEHLAILLILNFSFLTFFLIGDCEYFSDFIEGSSNDRACELLLISRPGVFSNFSAL